MEVTVGDDAMKGRDAQEIPNDDDLPVKRIGEGRGRIEIGAVGTVILRGVREFAQHGQAGAGASDGNAVADGVVQGALDGSAAPEIDVVRLVSAGDEDRGGGADGFDDERIIRGVMIGNDERGDGIFVAERLDVRIVGVGTAGADDQEIASAGALAEPDEGMVQVFTAADERVARVRGDMDISGISDAEVAISRRVGGSRRANRQGNRSCGDNQYPEQYKDKRRSGDKQDASAQEATDRRRFKPSAEPARAGETSAQYSEKGSRQ